MSLKFPANTAAGDLILVGFGFSASATASSVTDSQGNSFTQVGSQLTTPGSARSVVYYAKNIKGGAETVTVNLSADSAYIELYLAEYSGIDKTSPIDAHAGSSGKAGTASSGNATTTHTGDVIFGFCEADWACTVGSGFAARSTLVANMIEDKTAGSAGSYAATGSANNGWTMQMVALKPASAGPAISSATTASGIVGTSFSYQITASNSPTSYSATGLPAGLTVNSATGLISGKPTAAGTSTVTLSATNSIGTGTATLTLTITLPLLSINATTVAFGNVALNKPATQTVTLTSTGSAPVTVSAATITTGIGYTLSGTTPPVTLSTGQQTNLEVEFDPTATAAVTGQLTITSTSSSNGVAVITLTGTGVTPAYAVDLSWDAPSSSTDPVAGYNIYRSLSGSSAYQLIDSSADTQTTYTDTTVLAGQTYDYVLESVDSSGNESGPTSPVAVTIP